MYRHKLVTQLTYMAITNIRNLHHTLLELILRLYFYDRKIKQLSKTHTHQINHSKFN